VARLQISVGFASWQRYCTALQYWASAKLCGIEQRAPPIFSRATITLGIDTTVLCPVFWTTWVSRCQKRTSGLYGARKDNRGRHTDHLGGRHSIRTNQRFLPPSIFFAGCPSGRNPPNLSWLGTGTKYAGLRSQWHGLDVRVYADIFIIIIMCKFLVRLLQTWI